MGEFTLISEHIAADVLLEFEEEGYTVAPSARAAQLGTDRGRIRELVAHELGLATSPFRIAHTMADYWSNIGEIGFPCMVKPLSSSSEESESEDSFDRLYEDPEPKIS